jgi:hypothetical protein
MQKISYKGIMKMQSNFHQIVNKLIIYFFDQFFSTFLMINEIHLTHFDKRKFKSFEIIDQKHWKELE